MRDLRFEVAPEVALTARETGEPHRPRVLLLHGFPEASFVWEPTMAALAGEACLLAPCLRGYAPSSMPAELAAYKPRRLVADLVSLIEQWARGPLDLLVAHDWGGALAWNLAAQRPDLLRRLLIINSPHPALFLRELRDNPAQQRASAYMNALCRPEAAVRLARDDFAALWAMLEGMSATATGPGGWLTDDLRARYRASWSQGLEGALNWYRASPLRPPGGTEPEHKALDSVALVPDATRVRVPTWVLWGEADTALLPGLLDGLEEFVTPLAVRRVAQASHWIIHEQPARVLAEIRAALAG